MTCEDRVKKLPAYLEGELPPRESEEFKNHLASCETCRKTLEDLKAADRLVRNLGEVEPPPWLKQQIMTRVREV
ncbi:MAG TPA: anti-sigma factor, partial [Syntrophales bacterium]|nr:anti-sigma factor [Syntrophales bacterium]